MKQALLLCGGQAKRLRPYSHILPKACLPFLNLPLLSLPFFYLEKLGVSEFFFNTYLFPEKLKKTARSLSLNTQTLHFLDEDDLYGGAGTLFSHKSKLNKEYFFYINGDSLFFPSSLEKLTQFEEQFLKEDLDGLFYCAPFQKNKEEKKRGGLFFNKEGELKEIGYESSRFHPSYFSGLAIFKTSLLSILKKEKGHLFNDFIIPLLNKKKFKVFYDEKAQILEAGEIPSYLMATDICMKSLFKKEEPMSSILREIFVRFDKEDKRVGFKRGEKLFKKQGLPILASESVSGLELVKGEDFLVLGEHTQILEKSKISRSILSSHIKFQGDLKEEILLKTRI